MGFSSSQVHLLALTSRKHDIGLELEHLSNDKQILTREMQNVSREYNQALSAKTLKWSNNSGVSYIDLSYSTLMRPSTANKNKPYLITNSNGRIVLDNKYRKYAELISEDGRPNGDYESNRTYILSQLTGIPESKFDDYTSANDVTNGTVDALEKAKNATTAARKKAFETLNAEKFVQKWGTAGGIDFANTKMSRFDFVDVGTGPDAAKQQIDKIAADIIANITPFLEERDLAAFMDGVDGVANNYKGNIDAVANGNTKNDTIRVSDNNYSINMSDFISQIMGGFVSACGKNGSSCAIKTSDDDYKFEVVAGKGLEDDNYKAYLSAKAAEEEAKATYTNAVNNENQVFTAEEETQIKFYDLLFNAIAEKGWEEDSQIMDNDYLSNMLQNNVYTITTIEENTNYDADEKFDSSKKNKFHYNTDIASNFNNIFIVNDEDARQEALANYEYQKSIINAKESRIDQRMKNLETEQSAINQMIQGIEQVKKDNTETYFSIFA